MCARVCQTLAPLARLGLLVSYSASSHDAIDTRDRARGRTLRVPRREDARVFSGCGRSARPAGGAAEWQAIAACEEVRQYGRSSRSCQSASSGAIRESLGSPASRPIGQPAAAIHGQQMPALERPDGRPPGRPRLQAGRRPAARRRGERARPSPSRSARHRAGGARAASAEIWAQQPWRPVVVAPTKRAGRATGSRARCGGGGPGPRTPGARATACCSCATASTPSSRSARRRCASRPRTGAAARAASTGSGGSRRTTTRTTCGPSGTRTWSGACARTASTSSGSRRRSRRLGRRSRGPRARTSTRRTRMDPGDKLYPAPRRTVDVDAEALRASRQQEVRRPRSGWAPPPHFLAGGRRRRRAGRRRSSGSARAAWCSTSPRTTRACPCRARRWRHDGRTDTRVRPPLAADVGA